MPTWSLWSGWGGGVVSTLLCPRARFSLPLAFVNKVLFKHCHVHFCTYYLWLSSHSPWRRKWKPTLVFLPGKSPWTEEPGGLQSTGSQRIRHNRATKQQHFLTQGQSKVVVTETSSLQSQKCLLSGIRLSILRRGVPTSGLETCY